MEGYSGFSTSIDHDDMSSFGFDEIETYSDDDIQQMNEEQSYDRARQMYDLIKPLLDRLEKDADKQPMINWPNRKKSIQSFRKKLKTVANIK